MKNHILPSILHLFCYAGWRCLVCLPAADFFSVCCHWIPFSIAKSRIFGNISLSSLIVAPSLAALFSRRLISFITSRSTVALCELSLCSTSEEHTSELQSRPHL